MNEYKATFISQNGNGAEFVAEKIFFCPDEENPEETAKEYEEYLSKKFGYKFILRELTKNK